MSHELSLFRHSFLADLAPCLLTHLAVERLRLLGVCWLQSLQAMPTISSPTDACPSETSDKVKRSTQLHVRRLYAEPAHNSCTAMLQGAGTSLSSAAAAKREGRQCWCGQMGLREGMSYALLKFFIAVGGSAGSRFSDRLPGLMLQEFTSTMQKPKLTEAELQVRSAFLQKTFPLGMN